jgi:hypothetical protein
MWLDGSECDRFHRKFLLEHFPRKVICTTSESFPMANLVTISRFTDPDAAYGILAEARRGLSEHAAAAFDARLVLILANHIGDLGVLQEAVALAKQADQAK